MNPLSFIRPILIFIGMFWGSFGLQGNEPNNEKTGTINAIHLTLNPQIQAALETSLGQLKGAVVVVDVNNGDILGMASHPCRDKITRAWFSGFAPADHPIHAFCVMIEDGESGGVTAAPVAGNFLRLIKQTGEINPAQNWSRQRSD